MRHTLGIVTSTYAAILWPTMAQSTSTDSSNVTAIIELLQASVPACAFNCFVSEVPQSTCSLTDTACICTNTDLASSITTCLAQQNCTVYEQLLTLRFENEMCGVESHDGRASTIAIVWIMFSLTLLFVIARLIARVPHFSRQSWDDYMLIACLVALIPASAIGHMMVQSGLGRDIWNLEPEQITKTLYYFFIEEFIYTFLVVFTKISILALYLRVFAVPHFKLVCYILIGIVIAFGISCWVSTGFNCTPIAYMWEGWDGQHDGTCIDTAKQALALAGVNMTLDIIVFVLPIPQLFNLQMSWKRKIAICLMFMVGLFVTICSVVRLHTLMIFGSSANPTYDYTPLAVWSLVEIDVGVMCACMPGVAGLLKRMWPRLFSTDDNYDYDGREQQHRNHPSSLSHPYARDSTAHSGAGGGGGRGMSRRGDPLRKHQGFERMESPLRQQSSSSAKGASVAVSFVAPEHAQFDSKSDEVELIVLSRHSSEHERARRDNSSTNKVGWPSKH